MTGRDGPTPGGPAPGPEGTLPGAGWAIVPATAVAAVLAADGVPPARAAIWLSVALASVALTARAIARLADAYAGPAGGPPPDDAPAPGEASPSGAGRSAGRPNRRADWVVALTGTLLLISAARQMAPLAVALSPVPVLALVLHPAVGRWPGAAAGSVAVARAMAPLGAWLAVRGSVEGPAWLLAGAVVAGMGALDSAGWGCGPDPQPARVRPLLALSGMLWLMAGWATGRGWSYFGALGAAAAAVGWALGRAARHSPGTGFARKAPLAVAASALVLLAGALADAGF